MMYLTFVFLIFLIVTAFFIYYFFNFNFRLSCCFFTNPLSSKRSKVILCFFIYISIVVFILWSVTCTDVTKGPYHGFFFCFNKVINHFGYFTPLAFMCFIYFFIFLFFFFMDFFFSKFCTGRRFKVLVLASLFFAFFMCFLFLNFDFYTFNFFLFYFGSTCLLFSFIAYFIKISNAQVNSLFLYLLVFCLTVELFFWPIYVIYHSAVYCPSFIGYIGFVLDFTIVTKKGILFFSLKDFIISGAIAFKFHIIFNSGFTRPFFKCQSIYVFMFYSLVLIYLFLFYFMYIRIYGPEIPGLDVFTFVMVWYGHFNSLNLANSQTERFLRSFSGSVLFFFFSILFYFDSGFSFAYSSFFVVSYSLLLFFNYLFFYMLKNKIYNKNPVVFYLFFFFFFLFSIVCYFIYFGSAYFGARIHVGITGHYYFFLAFDFVKNFMFYFFFLLKEYECYFLRFRFFMWTSSFLFVPLYTFLGNYVEGLPCDEPLLWFLVALGGWSMSIVVHFMPFNYSFFYKIHCSKFELKAFYKKAYLIFFICSLIVFFLVFLSYLPDIVSVLSKK